MVEAPKDLSGEVVIHHPNCGADFQHRHYDEEQNVNFFQCVACGLVLRVDALIPGDVQNESSAEDTAEQAREPEEPAVIDVAEPTDDTPTDKSNKRRKQVQPDHIR